MNKFTPEYRNIFSGQSLTGSFHPLSEQIAKSFTKLSSKKGPTTIPPLPHPTTRQLTHISTTTARASAALQGVTNDSRSRRHQGWHSVPSLHW